MMAMVILTVTATLLCLATPEDPLPPRPQPRLLPQVRTVKRNKNLLTLMQSFDCNTNYVGVFGGPSLVGRSIACFGMAVLYRYR